MSLHEEDQIVLHTLGWLDAVSLVNVGAGCMRLQKLRDGLWAATLERLLPAAHVRRSKIHLDPRSLLVELVTSGDGSWRACDPCEACQLSLEVTTPLGHRGPCPCLSRRMKLPLVLSSFSLASSGGGSVCEHPGFSELRCMLAEHFALETRPFDTIEPGLLHGVHLLVLETTYLTRALLKTELEEIWRFVRAGGTAVFNAFSHMSSSGTYAEELLAPLGISVQQGAPFGRATAHPIDMESVEQALLDVGFPRNRMLRGYRAGQLVEEPEDYSPRLPMFANVGETLFKVGPDAVGALQLTRRRVLRNTGGMAFGGLALFPRGTPMTELGQVLVCSNMHFMADAQHWQGGTCKANKPFLLNLAASAATQGFAGVGVAI
eukprot:CAMPEP_0170650300 /NCGR_PEP_ID=MMETSP0224-20130122/45733_1 /TAXON_ID=285029 /ORGANISM="Togula jolla, Strain CCCM 725" /LENGTH=375 /DNA_ID=CAMNT_0010981961 /DNA_START=39 /DNA_END=1167 /DNA_ORIENTATION=-